MTRQFKIEAVVSASSQTSSKNDHTTTITLLADTGERLVLAFGGHAVARLKRHLANALLPRSVEKEKAA